MTEIQPSPPGYRGQDEAPGPHSCSPGSFKYAGHSHHADQQQQHTNNYVKSSSVGYNNGQENFIHKQSTGTTRGSSPGEQQNHTSNGVYRRKSENTGGRRSSIGENDGDVIGHAETNNQSASKTATIAGYNEGYKKNTPGYKNDSGLVFIIY